MAMQVRASGVHGRQARRGLRMRSTVLAFVAIPCTLLVLATACAQAPRPDYRRASVQPVTLARVAGAQLRIGYSVPQETLYHSPGVDYREVGDTLRVAIRRCGIRTDCAVMARPLPPAPASDPWHADVLLPYRGQRVVMVYSDGEESLTP
jgi:hypothetical protein